MNLIFKIRVYRGLSGTCNRNGVLQARATEALPEARGTAVAAFAMALFFGQSIGELVFGTILHMSGYAAVFVVAAIATLSLMVWSRRLLSA